MSDGFPGPVVCSEHSVRGSVTEISEPVSGWTLTNNAFQRRMVRAISMVGYPELGALDVLVLHGVYHRQRWHAVDGAPYSRTRGPLGSCVKTTKTKWQFGDVMSLKTP